MTPPEDGGQRPAVSTPPRGRTSRPGRRMFILTLTIVVVLVLGGVLLAWRGYNSRRDDALDEFGSRAPTAAAAAQRFFEEHLAFLGSIAGSPDVQSGVGTTMQPHLERVLAA